MTRSIPTVLRIVAALVAVVVAMPTGGLTAQTVGSSTIDGGAEWQYSVEASSPNGGILVHQSLAETYFMYLEEDLAGLPVADNAALLEGVTLPRFREAFGVAEMPLVAQGNLVTSLWHLYEMASTDGPVLVLFVVDVTEIPGAGAVEILIAPKATFADGLASAKANITINGFTALIGAVPSTAILNAAGLPSSSASTTQPTQAPPVATTPAAVPTTATAAQQGGGSTQTVTVGQDTIAYGGDWGHSPDPTAPDIAFFTAPSEGTVVFAYASGPNNVEAGPIEGVEGATDAFFADFGAQNLQQLVTEELPSGRAWGLTVFERNGVPGVFLIESDVTTPGLARVQFLVAPGDEFTMHFSSTQASFQINGVPAFSEIDVNRVTSLLGGGAQQVPAAPTRQPETPGQASLPAGGQAADYRAQDATTGCDRIGWVMTDPSQLPVTQADLDVRSSCVGGATYAASCGTYLDTATGVHCTVNVAVGTTPIAVTSQQFTLVDATGGRYPVDTEAMFSHFMLLGGPELPETMVEAGTTTRGMLIFDVPIDAPTPWVIEVAPDTLATTGEQPGILVIEGPLQPYSVFGQ